MSAAVAPPGVCVCSLRQQLTLFLKIQTSGPEHARLVLVVSFLGPAVMSLGLQTTSVLIHGEQP